MPASLLVEQRKIILYNKTLHSNNIVSRILCSLHRNEAQKLSAVAQSVNLTLNNYLRALLPRGGLICRIRSILNQ